MPTYEYECSKCGSTFEAFQTMSEPPLKKCEVCGAKKTVSRLVGAGAGLIFKGSGFYITDYKKGSSSPSTTNNTKEKKNAEKASEKKEKSETKTTETKTKSSSEK